MSDWNHASSSIWLLKAARRIRRPTVERSQSHGACAMGDDGPHKAAKTILTEPTSLAHLTPCQKASRQRLVIGTAQTRADCRTLLRSLPYLVTLQRQNRASNITTGSGTPRSHNNIPRPSPMTVPPRFKHLVMRQQNKEDDDWYRNSQQPKQNRHRFLLTKLAARAYVHSRCRRDVVHPRPRPSLRRTRQIEGRPPSRTSISWRSGGHDLDFPSFRSPPHRHAFAHRPRSFQFAGQRDG
jgi:hypothetical protein